MNDDYEYSNVEEDYEVEISRDVLTKSTIAVIVNVVTEAGAEIHFGDDGNIWVSYLKSGKQNDVPS